jgi:PTS system N-acetylglucosamine-specific IIA component
MIEVVSPVAGLRLEVSDVPDPVFSAGLVGPGAALSPGEGRQDAVAPIDGELVKLHPHAFLVLGRDGYGVLVHLGIDTVHLDGDGFRLLAEEGDLVRAGQPIVSWDPAHVTRSGRSSICAVVVLDCTLPAVALNEPGATVDRGEPLFALDPSIATHGG